MKLHILLFSLCLGVTGAFVATKPASTGKLSSLDASKNDWISTATAIVGWGLAAQIASASIVPPPLHDGSFVSENSYPSTVLAGGAYIPEASFQSTDFSMPSYNVDSVKDLSLAGGMDSASKQPKAAKEGETVKATKAGGPSRAEIAAMRVAEKKAEKAAAKAAIAEKQAAKLAR